MKIDFLKDMTWNSSHHATHGVTCDATWNVAAGETWDATRDATWDATRDATWDAMLNWNVCSEFINKD